MAFPRSGEWSEKAHNAGSRGYNLLVDFERDMHQAYPACSHLKFGFFSDDDINYQTTIGWRHLKADMFDVEDFNSTVGLRFGLRVDAANNVWYNNNCIMIMDRGYRDEVVLPARLEAIKRIERAAQDDQVVVHPEDPEYNKMKEAGSEIARSEKVKVQVRGEPDRGKEADSEEW